jgi:hypothetical protein
MKYFDFDFDVRNIIINGLLRSYRVYRLVTGILICNLIPVVLLLLRGMAKQAGERRV